MGLDITAYSHLRHLGRHTGDKPRCDVEGHIEALAYEDFPRSFRGIPILGRYANADGSAFLEGGCFEQSAQTDTHAFHAGSYSGYGRWRENLANQFNPQPEVPGETYRGEPDPERPFYELIWFADNEGCIGPEAAADLLADFRAHAGDYQPCFWQDTYHDWTRAFELAADGGLVRFH